jgi:hypothetical protein
VEDGPATLMLSHRGRQFQEARSSFVFDQHHLASDIAGVGVALGPLGFVLIVPISTF